MPGVNDGLSAGAAAIARLRGSGAGGEGSQAGGGYYTDSVHDCTRGTGLFVHHGDCTAAELVERPDTAANDAELTRRINQAEQAVRSRVATRPLTQDQFDALVSATFNLGARGVRGVLDSADANDDTGVINGLHARVHAPQHDRAGHATGRTVILPGLVTRRAMEARPFQPRPDSGR